MAIGTGASTEIIRSILMEDVVNLAKDLITGIVHHTYVIMSITVYCDTLAASGDQAICSIYGYDSVQPLANSTHTLFKQAFTAAGQTYVFDTKVAMFGFDAGANTDAGRVAQGGSNAQKLQIISSASGTKFDVTCSYIDQNWT
tara:strand:+ start:8023 stop:8451 length:429 start_codon:yes stop_codon:yes gene_type:complete